MICTKIIFSIQTHEDIDRVICEDIPLSAWYQFLDWYYQIIYERVLLKESEKIDINVCINIIIILFFSYNIYSINLGKKKARLKNFGIYRIL